MLQASGELTMLYWIRAATYAAVTLPLSSLLNLRAVTGAAAPSSERTETIYGVKTPACELGCLLLYVCTRLVSIVAKKRSPGSYTAALAASPPSLERLQTVE